MKLKKTSENQINETWADKWFILDQDGQIELNQKYLSNTWLLIQHNKEYIQLQTYR